MPDETACIKLGWALGQTHDRKEVKNIMPPPSLTAKQSHANHNNGYIVYQGDVPEREEFVRKVHK